MVWWPYFTSWSKRSLIRGRLMGHILCKWRLLRHYFEGVWVVLGGQDIILGGWVWVGVYKALFWVGVGVLENILVGWVWVGMSGGEWEWVRVGALFDNAQFENAQVYVTSELKIKLFCFFIMCAMVWIFAAVKNIYLLHLSAVLKFAKTQN